MGFGKKIGANKFMKTKLKTGANTAYNNGKGVQGCKNYKMIEFFATLLPNCPSCPGVVGPVLSRRASLVRSRQVRLGKASSLFVHRSALPKRQAFRATSPCLNVVCNHFLPLNMEAERF